MKQILDHLKLTFSYKVHGQSAEIGHLPKMTGNKATKYYSREPFLKNLSEKKASDHQITRDIE